MGIKLQQIATWVDGKLDGDGELVIESAAILSSVAASQISFVDHPKLLKRALESPAAALVIPEDWEAIERPAIRVSDVRAAFAQIVNRFRPPFEPKRQGISVRAEIDPSAKIADDVDVHAFAVIGPEVEIGSGSTIHAGAIIMGRCKIGRDVTIYPRVTLYRDTQVGDRTVIHSGAVIGANGFGYDTVAGQHQPAAQLGYVIIEADVEIGANTTVDRASYNATVIGQGTKIDNLVMVAHNCQVGEHNLICSQVGIAGSSTTGNYVVMAGQVGIPDHVSIGHQSVIGAKSGVMRDVPDGSTMLGIPATPERDQMAKQAAFAKLPEMRRQVRDLRRRVEKLMATVDEDSEQASAQPEAA